ncbi:MAG: A/G-specific adenine glycosylase [Phycisphaerales bacterium]|nr:A/G-specific adenine glycosylase [Phycisphaerales bacterium]
MPRSPRTNKSPAMLEFSAVRRHLLTWYRRHARDLPWRRRASDAYAVWLSEMMLQQTQTATVIPYFAAFLKRFPNVTALARADRAEVLRMWAGLGYYRRAHHLHDAARHVAFELDGKFPDTVEGLLKLPGVGRYSAGAIASIAFNRRAPILDGNVKRVLARLVASTASPDAPAEVQRLWSLAEDILPQRNCGAFNQALMDLGATICTPKSPRCDACPLTKECAAFRQGVVASIPKPRQRAAVRRQPMVCLLIVAGDHVLVSQRADRGLWAGTWTPPAVDDVGGDAHAIARDALPATILRRMTQLAPCGSVQHQLTHRAVTFAVHTATAPRIRVPAKFRWLPLAERKTLPTAFRKVVALLEEPMPKRSRRAS